MKFWRAYWYSLCLFLLITGCSDHESALAPEEYDTDADLAETNSEPLSPSTDRDSETIPSDHSNQAKQNQEYPLEQIETLDDIVNQLHTENLKPASFLKGVIETWNDHPTLDFAQVLAESDLNQDGQTEWIIAVNPNQHNRIQNGKIAVIYQDNGTYQYTSYPDQYPVGILTKQFTVEDIDGDKHPEIISAAIEKGFAHTAFFHIFVTRWKKSSGFSQLGKNITIPSLSNIEIADNGILITGGLIHSAGAGMEQREYTDRYELMNGQLIFSDRTYKPSPYGYHLLQDGLLSEALGKTEQAKDAYLKAIQAKEALANPNNLEVNGTFSAEHLDSFQDAVQHYARLRLAMLYLKEGNKENAQEVARHATGSFAEPVKILGRSKDIHTGIAEAKEWLADHPQFLDYLNAPYGYANPKWKLDTLFENIYKELLPNNGQ
ncbi:MAG: hypothetical protein H0Z32_15860 [Bacillaceae bacterium]|nr:hypothetical protein [Bacillaceae bacterium]